MTAQREEIFDGLFFDGVSSRAEQVVLTREMGGDLILRLSEENQRRIPVREYVTIRPVGGSPIVLRLEGGSEIHIKTDNRSRVVFGVGASKFTRVIEAIETRPVSVLSVVIAAVCVSLASYIYGLPLLAEYVAPRIPIAVKREIGSQGLVFLDRVMFMPTELSQEQQARLKALVAGLQGTVALSVAPVVMTRRMGQGSKEAANAMALLPNTIIATDKLVAALDDAELEAVLAHEMGHLHLDHGTQSLVRGSAVSIATLVLFGGDPGVFQALAINLVDSKSSRDHERAADLFALECLAKTGRDPKALYNALRKISEGHEESGLGSYLASHPMTSERLANIERYSQQVSSVNK